MRSKAKFIIKHPNWLFDYITRKSKLIDILGCSSKNITTYLNESKEIWVSINNLCEKYHVRPSISFERLQILYCCVRHIKPEMLVETGVAVGSSSYAILIALEKNQKGFLNSIDIGYNHTFSDGFQTGKIIPENLKQRWHLTIGDSKEKLPELLKKIVHLDFFYHDSDHSYEHMMFEFKTIFPFLSNHSYILADDIYFHTAFDDFTKGNSLNSQKFYGFGVATRK